jgi:hypothetical protein
VPADLLSPAPRSPRRIIGRCRYPMGLSTCLRWPGNASLKNGLPLRRLRPAFTRAVYTHSQDDALTAAVTSFALVVTTGDTDGITELEHTAHPLYQRRCRAPVGLEPTLGRF